MSAKDEQETVVVMCRADDFALLYTSHAAMKAKWERAGYEVNQVDSHGWEAKVPQKCISFRKLDSVLNPKRGQHWKKENRNAD